MSDRVATLGARQAPLESRPLLVGRQKELAHVIDLLRGGSPALVLVGVEAGLGQTTFLRAVAAAAREGGFAVVREDDQGELTVTPATTSESFSARVRSGLGIPPHQALVSTSGEFESRINWEPVEQGVRSALPAPASDVRDPLIDQLRRLPDRPCVLIDGYRPSNPFAAWFRDTFMADLFRAGIHAVVLVADVREALRPLASMHHASVELGILDREELVRFFERLSDVADPPLTPSEVEIFAQEGASRPELVAALHNLIALLTKRVRGSPLTVPPAPNE